MQCIMFRRNDMKPLSETWKQKKHVPSRNLTDCSTPINSKVKLVEDVSPTDGFGNTQLFCDADFLRAVDDLERIHTKQRADTVHQTLLVNKVSTNSDGDQGTPVAHKRSQCLLRSQASESSSISTSDSRRPVGTVEPRSMSSSEPSCEAIDMPIVEEPASAEIVAHADATVTAKDNRPPRDLLATPLPSSLLLSSWGLPEPVLECYRECGVESMFEWQVSCLASERVLDGGNLVYSAPTSAGKTLVAEILMLKCVLERKKKAIMILPFVSVAHEKMLYLKKMFRNVGIRVDGYMAQHAPAGGFSTVDIAVCTIEKANGLVNRLLEDGNLDQLGIIVVDELHMVGDSSRGFLLELLLTKIGYMQKKCALVAMQEIAVTSSELQPCRSPTLSIQVVGMSATLPNLDLLARWLEADLFCTQFRPVPLTECVKVGLEVRTVLDDDDTLIVTRLLKPSPMANDADHVVQLSLETVADGHGVLIFCPAKQWCENLAETLAKEFFQLGKDQENTSHGLAHLRAGLRANLKGDSLVEVLGHLKKSPAGLDKSLAKTVPFGVAFHHAGLTMDEREILEVAFRQGALKVLTATSTLSSGVNLPARRVIVRTPISHHGLTLDVLTYRQMIGRAGRKGFDDRGESILICKPAEVTKAVNLVKAKLKPVSSCLAGDGEGTLSPAMKRAILEIVVSGAATNPAELDAYTACTLLACSTNGESGERPQNVIKDYVDFLVQNEFIRLQTVGGPAGEDVRYSSTPLGRAVLASSLSPDEGLVVYNELEKARRCFVLENELHIIYQVTPIYLTEQWSKLDWVHYFELWERLPPDMKRVSSCVGVEERFLASASRGLRYGSKSDLQYTRQLSVHLRFYTALALHDLVNEMPLSTVARKYGCNKGLLQSLQQMAAVFSGMVTVFCHQLGWLNLELLLAQFQSRLHFGVHQELCGLVRLSCLNARRARNFHDAGYKTVAQLAVANPIAIENVLRNSEPFESKRRKENENERELAKRLEQKTIWIPGRKGISEADAAVLVIQEAREVLQKDLGIFGVAWNTETPVEEPYNSVTEESANATAHINDDPHSVENATIKAPVELSTQQAVLTLVENCAVDNELSNPVSDEKLTVTAIRTGPETYTTTSNSLCVCDMHDGKEISNKNESFGNAEGPSLNLNFSLTFGANQFLDRLIDDRVVGNDMSFAAADNCKVSSPCASELELSMSEADRSTPELLLENGNWTLASRKHHPEPKSNVELATTTEGGLAKNAQANVLEREGCEDDIVESESPGWLAGKDARIPPDVELTIDESSSDEADNEQEKIHYRLFPNDSVFDHSYLMLTPNVDQRTAECESKKRLNTERLPDESESKKVCGPVGRNADGDTSASSMELFPPTPSPKVMKTSNNACGGMVTPTIRIVNSRKTLAGSVLQTCGEKAKESSVGSPVDTSDGRTVESGASHLVAGSAKMVVVTDDRAKFVKFLEVWASKTKVSICFAAEKKAVVSVADAGIGRNIVKDKRNTPKTKPANVQLPSLRIYDEDVVIVGMAVCWDEDTVYYIAFDSGQTPINTVVHGVSDYLFNKSVRKVIIAYELKEQFKALYEVFGGLPQNFEGHDPRVAAWLLDVTSANNTFLNFVSACLPGKSPPLKQDFDEKATGSPGLTVSGSQRSGRHRAVTEALLTLKLMTHMLIELQNEKLLKGYKEIEMPVLVPFLKMELNGLGFNEKSFQHSRVLIQTRVAELEARSEGLLGHPLNMACKTDLRRALYEELQLPSIDDQKLQAAHPSISRRMTMSSALLASPSRFMKGRRIRREESTIKETLQRLVPFHELPGIVLEWRRLQSALTQKVIPIMKEKTFQSQLKMHRVYGNNETHTLTGRAVLNLQMVERDFLMESRTSNANFLSQSDRFNLTTVSLRRAFVPHRGGVLVSADYSQLELRVLAHLSEDVHLIRVLNGGVDVFRAIAAQWKGRNTEQISDDERQQAKQICYGMIYGIGSKSLGEKLGVTKCEALAFMDGFKSKYPGIDRYVRSVHDKCRRLGYVETLMGRRRPLPAINDEDAKKKAEAERQAVNTTIQGTAADIAKRATIDVDRQMEAAFAGTSRPLGRLSWQGKSESASSSLDGLMTPARGGHFVLHLHDELIYETNREDAIRVAKIIKNCMESAVKLMVRLPVKVKIGPTWGDLSDVTDI